MAELSIQDSRAFSGEWWLPENPTSRISGALEWSGERAILSLDDRLVPVEDGPQFGDTSVLHTSLHGATSASQLVTLQNALQTGVSFNFGLAGMKLPEKLLSSLVVIGGHVDGETEYDEVRVRVPGLELWLGMSGIVTTLIQDGGDRSVNCFVGGAEDIETPVKAETTIIRWTLAPMVSPTRSNSFSVREVGYIKIRPAEPKAIDWYFGQMERVFSILALLAGTPMSYDQMKARPVGGSPLEVLVGRSAVTYCNFTDRGKFFISRQPIASEFGAIMGRWFEIYDTIEEAVQLSLSVLRSKALWPHVEFLSLIQALEGYHRCTSTSTLMNKADFQKVKDALYAALPASLSKAEKDTLKSRISFGNEVSLKTRMTDLVGRIGHDLAAIILGEEGKFPRSWIDTRNFYSHWEPELKPKRLSQGQMIEASARMKSFLRTLMLLHAGVPGDTIKAALGDGCDESQYLIQLNCRDHRAKNPGSTAGAYMFISRSGAVPNPADPPGAPEVWPDPE